MNKRKILKNIFMMILTSTMLIGNMSSLVKAENIDGSILAVKNTTPALQNILRENGEKELSSDEYKIIDSKDNKYVEEKSTDIPYVNFTIKIDDSVDDLSKVKVNWTGHASNGNKVYMYAWNVKNSLWDKLCENNVQDDGDFTLSSELVKGDYNDNNNIHVKVLSDAQDNDNFTFAWMTDTQFYAQSYPDIFNTDVNYILNNKEKENIKYVIHTGDIINNSEQEYQWKNADSSLEAFDTASMPYGVLAGNHDVVYNSVVDYSQYKKYFGENRYKNKWWYGASYEDNKGHYDLISEDGNDFIILYMGWDIGEKEYKWMNEVLSKNKDKKAILCFHKYLGTDGKRDDIGEGIYDNVILKNSNVFMVLCGHYYGASNRVDEIDDNKDGIPDRKVYQILSDYQGGDNGGNGYIRLMSFDEKNGTVNTKTYSPKLDDYNFYDNNDSERNSLGYKDEFTIPLKLNKSTKVLATDYFSVEGNKAQSVSSKQNQGVEITVDNNKNQDVGKDKNSKLQNEELDNNTAKTGDMYLEMIVIIMTISVFVVISEIRIKREKGL